MQLDFSVWMYWLAKLFITSGTCTLAEWPSVISVSMVKKAH